ncbi:MAG: hypothetical protein K9I85_05010 [Saprospiraceae bacterium]|nr:hypothetical protein [Saprospiraceae bacterium]
MAYISAILISISWSLSGWLPASFIETQAELPLVFQLAESEQWTSDLEETYSISLLNACHNDPKVAFQHWRSFTQRIQQLTLEHGLLQPGLQIWIKAYWNKDGQLEHIGYGSRNGQYPLDHQQWHSLFEQLIKENLLSGHWNTGFYHLGSIKMY